MFDRRGRRRIIAPRERLRSRGAAAAARAAIPEPRALARRSAAALGALTAPPLETAVAAARGLHEEHRRYKDHHDQPQREDGVADRIVDSTHGVTFGLREVDSRERCGGARVCNEPSAWSGGLARSIPGASPSVAASTARFRRRSPDRKSTRLNSSHGYISYAVFCLKKKKEKPKTLTRSE